MALLLMMAAAGAFGCANDPTSPTPVASVAQVAGNWIGSSRVVTCDGPAVVCQQYPRGLARYLALNLNQEGQLVTGNLINTAPGPLVLPFPFPISGKTSSSGRLTFESAADAAAVNVGFSGEMVITLPAEMTGQMMEQSTHLGDPYLIAWELTIVRQ